VIGAPETRSRTWAAGATPTSRRQAKGAARDPEKVDSVTAHILSRSLEVSHVGRYADNSAPMGTID